MRVVIVEDDYLQADWIKDFFMDRASVSEDDIHFIGTELEFRRNMTRFREHPPDLFLIDIMLRWTDPEPEQEAPPIEVEKEGYHRAGLRCEKLLREANETRDVQVILYSVLEESSLEGTSLGSQTRYVGKSSDDSDLLMHIKELEAGR